MAAPLEHKHAHWDPGEWAHFWEQFQYRWECDNDDMDDIWLEGQSWTEPACGFITVEVRTVARQIHQLQLQAWRP